MKQLPRFIAPMTFGEAFGALAGPPLDDPRCLFEQRFSEFIGARRSVTAPSGRFALDAILSAFDFPKESQIILPALTFHSVPQMIRDRGLDPVFVDIGKDTYCLDPSKIQGAITEKTKALLPTHLYGRACDMERIGTIAAGHGLKVIEDCAQSCGGYWRERRLGSFGDAAYFSFGPTKNLAALWAGMIATDSDAVAVKARERLGALPSISSMVVAQRSIKALAMRFVAQPWFWRWFMAPALKLFAKMDLDPIEKMTAESPGNANAADIQARLMPHRFQMKIALAQLEKLDRQNSRRIQNGNRLLQALQGIDGLIAPAPAGKGENIFTSFPIQVRDRDAFRKKLLALGVDTTTGYMSVCPGLAPDQARKQAPEAFAAARQMVHLPVYPELSQPEVDFLAEAVTKAMKQ